MAVSPGVETAGYGGMKLVFIYGQAGVGKLTVARELAALTGMALFHNHLVVDAVAAVFPFGSPGFVRLREQFWLEVFAEAAKGTSLIFTFAPEDTVARDFPQRVKALVEAAGGKVDFIRLTAPESVQDQRINAASRSAFGKLTSLELLRQLRPQFIAAMQAMPEPILTIDTAATQPDAAARMIAAAIADQDQADAARTGAGGSE
jgi:hypothetical protein